MTLVFVLYSYLRARSFVSIRRSKVTKKVGKIFISSQKQTHLPFNLYDARTSSVTPSHPERESDLMAGHLSNAPRTPASVMKRQALRSSRTRPEPHPRASSLRAESPRNFAAPLLKSSELTCSLKIGASALESSICAIREPFKKTKSYIFSAKPRGSSCRENVARPFPRDDSSERRESAERVGIMPT